ncbi:MAG TPA: alginate export family protein [Woeseiaceae bacterium]|nr:alginate export family protein [Woeseiaceae bacterium]
MSVILLSSSVAVAADEGDDFKAALMSGKAGVNLRARYEHVDQDSFSEDADALTARLRLNYRTGTWKDFSAFVEFDYLFHLLDDFNSGGGTSPNRTQYPAIVDPDGADLNQLYLDYAIDGDSSVRLGRQRILLDNQRFVGGVGWRQNEQTYDALTISSKALQKTSLSYSYISHVRRIFGDSVPAGSNDVNAHLLNAKVSINETWSVTPYFYYIDNDDVSAFSTATLGANVAGKLKIGDGDLALLIEFATQDNAGNNPVSYNAQYLHLGGSYLLDSGLSLGLDFESLGGASSPGRSFRTPLATLHAFQGWADMFLATPGGGIDDLFATVKYKVGRWNLTGVYHDFSAETGGGDYGTEIDFSVGTAINDNLGILFKGALFNGDTATYPDTNKFWIMFTANY